MAYVINRYDGTAITTIEDGTVDQTLDIKLIGKNYAGYGEIQNENFVHMLENFARDSAPSNALRGQIWFDTVSKKIKFYTGDQVAGVKIWKTAGGVEYGTEPSNPTAGDLWFDTARSQLKVRTTASWLTVGPQTAGTGVTQMVSRQVTDTLGSTHSIIAATINDEVVYIISKDAEFTLATGDAITGFTVIKKGLTLAYVNATTGVNDTTSHVYWGTASNALKLGGYDAADFLRSSTSTFTAKAKFYNPGFTVGTLADYLAVYIDDATSKPYIENKEGATINFRVKDSVVKTPLVINGSAVEPGATTSYTLGSASKLWSNVYASTFTGTATQSDTLKETVSGAYRSASTAAGANTVAVRDNQGNITANVFSGVATSARYADLAEKYLADKEYGVGVVVVIGGEKEVTASSFGQRALGVVSGSPAFMMNKDLEGGTYIALKGRVPVRVVGPVTKGQRLIAADNGCATGVATGHLDTFAIALEDNQNTDVKIVECVIL